MIEVRHAKLADIEPLVLAAEADAHSVIRPTLVATKDGEFVGYASVGAVPLIFFWMHSKATSARETYKMYQSIETELKSHGATLGCFPCAKSSPLHPFVPKLGLVSYGTMDMFLKKL